MRPADKEDPRAHGSMDTKSRARGSVWGAPEPRGHGNQQFLSWSTDGGSGPGRIAMEATVKHVLKKNLKALNQGVT